METEEGYAQFTGRSHRLCEDRFRLLGSAVPLVQRAERGHLYAVIDGAGGAPRGMATAQLLADRLVDFFRLPPESATATDLNAVIRAASDEAYRGGFIEGTDIPRAAAAATVAWLTPSRTLVLVHAGDTAAWRWDGARLHPLTQAHGNRHELRRFVGQGPNFLPDCSERGFEEGSMLCMVSDGVTAVLHHGDIAACLSRARDAQEAADNVANLARQRRSPDDITVLCIELSSW